MCVFVSCVFACACAACVLVCVCVGHCVCVSMSYICDALRDDAACCHMPKECLFFVSQLVGFEVVVSNEELFFSPEKFEGFSCFASWERREEKNHQKSLPFSNSNPRPIRGKIRKRFLESWQSK